MRKIKINSKNILKLIFLFSNIYFISLPAKSSNPSHDSKEDQVSLSCIDGTDKKTNRYFEVKKYLDLGNSNYSDRNYKNSIHYFKKGIDELNNCYEFEGLLDDTDTKLLMAKSEERKDHLSNAADGMKTVLINRFLLFGELVDSGIFKNKSYLLAKKYLTTGQEDFLNEKFIEAIANFRNGIKELGYRYYVEPMLDDSGNFITIAIIEERKQNFRGAAKTLEGVLKDRLDYYKDGVTKNFSENRKMKHSPATHDTGSNNQ